MYKQNKYTKWYFNIINKAKSENRVKSKSQYYEEHHIEPKFVSNDNSQNNLVLLTAREHFICHYLLCKMFIAPLFVSKAYYSLNYIRKSTKHNKRYNSKLYQYIKSNLSEQISKNNSGRKRSSEFKQNVSERIKQSNWFVNIETQEERLTTEILQHPWVPGRNNSLKQSASNFAKTRTGNKNPAFGLIRKDLSERNKLPKAWVKKEGKVKLILKIDLQKYLSNGYEQGRGLKI